MRIIETDPLTRTPARYRSQMLYDQKEIIRELLAMQSSTLTDKGQVTIPAELRRRLGLKPGDRIGFELTEGAIRLLKREDRVEAAFGLIKSERTVTDHAMERAIRARGSNAAKG